QDLNAAPRLRKPDTAHGPGRDEHARVVGFRVARRDEEPDRVRLIDKRRTKEHFAILERHLDATPLRRMPVGFLFDVSGITGEVADEEDRLQAIEGNDDALVLGRGDRWPQRELSPRRVEVLAESFVGGAIREPDD